MSKHVHNNVLELRKSAGFTQAELAEKTDVTRQTIIAIEKGKYVPSVALALKISASLDKPVEEVFWL